MNEKMNVFFCVNSKAMLGLGTTLVSMIKNCQSSEKIKIWFLCNSLNQQDKNNIIQLLKNESFRGIYKFIDFDAEKEFGFLKSYHGDRTVYGRFLIPKIINSGFAYYLDTDVIINTNILNLQLFKSEKAISAVERRQFKDAKERLFFIEHLKLSPDTSYFNSGVLIININKWNLENISDKIIELGDTPTPYYSMADQTLLNAVIAGDYIKIPVQYNFPFPPSKKEIAVTDNVIIHFIGSPKPWDIFGTLIHNGYPLWKKYLTPFWLNNYYKISFIRIKRSWAIRNEYLKRKKNILSKFRSFHGI